MNKADMMLLEAPIQLDYFIQRAPSNGLDPRQPVGTAEVDQMRENVDPNSAFYSCETKEAVDTNKLVSA